MGCAVGTVKFVVFIFNFLLVCVGFAMVLFGALDSPMPDEFDKIPELAQQLSITSTVLIVAGGIIFVVAFFGCWGAVADSSCMLFLYAVFLMVLILVEAAVGVYVFVHKDTIEGQVSKYLHNFADEYRNQPNAKIIIDNFQVKAQCCGVDGPDDWAKQGMQVLPSSCCGDEKLPSCPPDRAYREGCVPKAWRLLNQKVKKYVWIVGAIVGVEVLTIVFALIVRNSILNERRRSLA